MFNVCFYAALSYFICILFSLAKPRVERALHIVCHSFLVGYSLSNVFLLLSFNRHWDAYILQFLSETNARESSEFVHTFILSYHTLGLVVFYALFIVAELWGLKRVKPWPAWAKSKVGRALEIAGMMLLVSHAFFFGSDAMTNDNRVGMVHSPIKRNAIWNLYQSVLMHKSFAQEFDRCAQTLQSYNEPVLCKERAADFVLIIGESFNRHMSNRLRRSVRHQSPVAPTLGRWQTLCFSRCHSLRQWHHSEFQAVSLNSLGGRNQTVVRCAAFPPCAASLWLQSGVFKQSVCGCGDGQTLQRLHGLFQRPTHCLITLRLSRYAHLCLR